MRDASAATLKSLLILFILSGALYAWQNVSLPTGITVEHCFYNEWGVQVGFSHHRILNGRPHAKVTYTTSRIGSATSSNALKTDSWSAALGWSFMPDKFFTPSIDLFAGTRRFDREDDALFMLLDNTSALLGVRLGIEASFWKHLIRPWASMGYNIITSHTVYPIVFSLGLAFDLSQGVFK